MVVLALSGCSDDRKDSMSMGAAGGVTFMEDGADGPAGSGGSPGSMGSGGNTMEPRADEPEDLLENVQKPETILSGLGNKADNPNWSDEFGGLVLIADGENKLYKNGEFESFGTSGVKALTPEGELLGADGVDDGGVLFIQAAPDEEKKEISSALPWPNDMVMSTAGHIYYSQRKGTLEDPGGDGEGLVRHYDPTSKVNDHRSGVPNPNGIALSPDEKTLYVAGSSYDDESQGGVFSLPIDGDGSLGEATRFSDIVRPDGMAVDPWGNLYVVSATKKFLGVFDSDGNEIGRIEGLPGSLTNCGFGGEDGSVLFVTSFKQVVKVPMGW